MKSKTTIELNGNRYDATTGMMLGAASAPQPRTGRNIDGFFRGRTSPALTKSVNGKITVLAAPAPVPHPHKQPSRTVNHARAHTPQVAKTAVIRVAATPKPHTAARHATVAVNHTKAHAPQSSQILMRKAVKRPAPSLLRQVNTQGALQHKVPSLIASKQSVASVDPNRLARAQTIARSPLVAHHGPANQTVQPFITPLPVQPVPVKPEGEVPSIAPAPGNKPEQPGDIFSHAIANATNFIDMKAHRAHFKKHARRHFTSMAAGTLALAVIAGFAAYQNTPGLQLKVASIQAGVSTTMPNFKAAGFAYNGARAQDGKLTVGFSGVSGNYQLVQQTTNLSSRDVIQYIGATDASGTPDYKTVQAGNTTVYRFDNTNATWVSGGKWYTVTGTGALTDSQVTSLVKNI